MLRVFEWVDERLEIKPFFEFFLFRKLPKGINWWWTFGSATLFLFTLQVTTGMFLALYYSPSPDHAWDSVRFIENEVRFGSLIRGIHHWSASGMVVLVVAHMLRVFVMGAYKYPREATWVVGVVLFTLVLGFGFTGYLLPWDEKAYWATVVGTNMAEQAPLIGKFVLKVLRGGEDLGAVTLTRFFALHVLFLPAMVIPLIGVHLFMVVKQGISAPPKKQ
ncbi:MAG: cytochrome b N-terminal domain-containing protein [Chloroflexi bacterium]|nr:cytochrome b N-terminal domain-containing protein [Chloroflexota bacterium]